MIARSLAVSAVALVAACSAPEQAAAPGPAATVAVADAVCRPSAPGRRMALCYVTLTASAADALIAAESPRSGRVAIQDVPLENGMLVLTPRAGPIALPAGQPVRLVPGGQALAMQGLHEPLNLGETVPLTLTFNAAPLVEVVAPVVAEPAA